MSASKEYKPVHGGYPGKVPEPKPRECCRKGNGLCVDCPGFKVGKK